MSMLGKQVRWLVVAGVLLLGGATALTYSNALASPAAEKHPHIRKALEELREARKELREAAHDFGGHRKKALEAVDVATEQLDKALKFAK